MPIFSDGDIDKTSEQFAELDNDTDLTSIIVTEEGVFALRVGNSTDLQNTENDFNLDEGETRDKFFDDFKKAVVKACSDNSCHIANFATFINTYQVNGHGLGLMLFQAVFDADGNIINWIEK